MPIDLNEIHSLLHSRHDRVLIAAAAGGGVVHATIGAHDEADAEIGSVSKGLTGLLYHDAVERGEVTPATTLGEALGRPEGSYASIPLSAVVTHSSGLPSQPAYPAPRSMTTRTWRWWRHGENPYGDTVDELLDAAADVRLGRRRFVYSNLGFKLVGAALSRVAGLPYEQLLQERVAHPLGMTGLTVPAGPACLSPNALTGRSKSGRPQESWTGTALGPAGGVRATAQDLAALLGALLDGTAPGRGALEPTADATGGSRIGAAWLTTQAGDSQVTWHNGRTGGFASWLGVDRAAGVGLAIVSATAASVDRAGFAGLAKLRAGIG